MTGRLQSRDPDTGGEGLLRVEKTGSGRVYTCRTCGAGAFRSGRYDAFYCTACNVWLEDACSDLACTYCVGRPAKPSEVDS